ncbi:MAG: hypothetical protein K2O67_06240 [Clostridia bacterium]|nr:hypothetical protein [Clostridia bacterium]
MKVKKLRGIAAAVAALIAVLPCAAMPVFAHPVPAYEYGITGSGVFTRDENSVLAVESEKLIFDIKDFPENSYATSTEYKSTITAEYKFVNTSNQTVHTSMAFPVGNTRRYVNEPIYNFTPVITVDGEQIEAQTRHTYGGYAQCRDYAEGVAEILDGWYEDDFYKPDTPVTAYNVKIDTSGYDDTLRVRGKVHYSDNMRYLAPGYYDGNIELFYYQNDTVVEQTIYVFGDSSDFYVEWQVEQQHFNRHIGPWYTKIDLPVEVTQVKNSDGTPLNTTLKELILSERQEGSVVSEQDYYNAIAINFLDNSDGSSRRSFVGDDQFCLWYTYDVEVEPNGSFVNSVTAPVYPTVLYGYDPYVYDYEYYLSPAKGWADFGKLEIEIKSDAYVISGALLEGAEYSDGSYKVTLDGLPDGELSFRLCSVEEPGPSRGSAMVAMLIAVIMRLFTGVFGVLVIPIVCVLLLILIVGITLLIVFLVRRKKKKNFESK